MTSNATNIYTRQAASFRNELKQSCGALVGLVQGILADGELRDAEIDFLHKWLANAQNVSTLWPGSVIAQQIDSVLADGVITEQERAHLNDTLLKLIGGVLDDIAPQINQLAFDDAPVIGIVGNSFCLTGDFAYGTRAQCEAAITQRGGSVAGITKKLNYLIVGGLGSAEWKHGSFGTKIQKAVEYRDAGIPLKIVHEDIWVAAMR